MGKLDDLLNKSNKNSQSYKSAFNDIKNIKIDNIETNPYQPRKEFNDESISELSESIKEDGLMQAISITDKNILIAGERRLRACKLLGFKEIECRIIKNVDDDKLERLAIIENLQREDLNVFDESVAISRLVEKDSVRNVAKMLSKSRGYIQDRVTVSKINDEAKKYVIENNIGLKNTIKIVENGVDFFKKTLDRVENKGGGFLKDTKKNKKKPDSKLKISEVETSNDKEKYALSESEKYFKKQYAHFGIELLFNKGSFLIRGNKNKINFETGELNLVDTTK